MARMKKTTRIAFDAVLSIMLIFEMFIQYTGDFLHEVVGFAFFATIVAHLLFSRTWMSSTVKAARTGKLPTRRRFKAIIGIALGVCMLLLGVSSIAISQILASFGFSMAGSYLVWKALHTFASYALCILVVVHLTSHWASLASSLGHWLRREGCCHAWRCRLGRFGRAVFIDAASSGPKPCRGG